MYSRHSLMPQHYLPSLSCDTHTVDKTMDDGDDDEDEGEGDADDDDYNLGALE